MNKTVALGGLSLCAMAALAVVAYQQSYFTPSDDEAAALLQATSNPTDNTELERQLDEKINQAMQENSIDAVEIEQLEQQQQKLVELLEKAKLFQTKQEIQLQKADVSEVYVQKPAKNNRPDPQGNIDVIMKQTGLSREEVEKMLAPAKSK